MADAAERFPAPTRRAGRRTLFVFAVLFGLFLMHGISASADAACADPPSTQVAAGTVGQSGPPVQTAAYKGVFADDAASTLTSDGCACKHTMASCTPLTGRDHGTLLGALLFALAAVPALQSESARRALARDSRSGRRRAAVAVLDLACVSRT
jgi:hypothetical protein